MEARKEGCCGGGEGQEVLPVGGDANLSLQGEEELAC